MIDGIQESRAYGLIVLSPATGKSLRRLIYLDNYGGAAMWEKIKQGDMPSHHLRGCLQLVRMGYEILLAEPLKDFYFRRNPLRYFRGEAEVFHDLCLLRPARSWLGKDGIIFCGHNVLHWIPLLRQLGLVQCHIVSNLWACEPLSYSGAHSAIVTLTPVGAEQARKLAPRVKTENLAWGVDLTAFPVKPYNPKWLLHCGIAGRDFRTLNAAASKSKVPLRIIGSWLPDDLKWPRTVQIIDGGKGFNFEDKKVSFRQLLDEHYAGSAGSLIINIADHQKNHALGFTNIIEAMAMSQPIILTRSGALPDEIDVEREGCGLFVPPNDPLALAEAMLALVNDPRRAEEMGRKSRLLCETRYNIDRYAADLHKLFQSL